MARRPVLRKGFIDNRDGTVTVPIENIWTRVRRWARRNGYEYNPTYGVVGIAPT
jgi:hypothetical protein